MCNFIWCFVYLLHSKIKDAIDHRMREIGNKFVLTDYDRAGRIVDVVKGLDFVRAVFVIGDESVTGCTQFNELLQDPGDGIHKQIPTYWRRIF